MTFQEWVEKWQVVGTWPKPEQLYRGRMGSVNAGWVPILDRLAEKLVAAGWDRRADQIKEKFGGLRFYIPRGNAALWDLIHEAEEESFHTCERCGAPGETRPGGWILTLCDACNAKR